MNSNTYNDLYDSSRDVKLCDLSSIMGSVATGQKDRRTTLLEDAPDYYTQMDGRSLQNHIDFGKSPTAGSQAPSLSKTEEVLLETLNYFIDQFTNLHAVCNRALDIDDDHEKLQLVANVMNQDLIEIEESAGHQDQSELFFSPNRSRSPAARTVVSGISKKENTEQVLHEQRHGQLINFAKRLIFIIFQKL